MPGELATTVLGFGQEITTTMQGTGKQKEHQGHLGMENNCELKWEKTTGLEVRRIPFGSLFWLLLAT